ncbi:ABC transporter ATP-binding protein [Glutamicibacter sp. ZJUTW]|uniref:ABC transporter ATP-binding protein n=1 Tax=Glutamicibacter sp. ZJUTW TaxID=1155384 RepID=UPI0011F0CE2C|nr:ATP-binding cassette domain-containing protein [Glutamicibacter sp. ZJUTW]QEP06591.1 ATP-binding cassette domain-containing protein [Glutamicibacter sp. ZJUTW]
MNTALAPEPAIEVIGLATSFKNLPVLRSLDFAVQPGSIFALLGSNGAGKTTLVRILATLLPADAGTARICGRATCENPAQVRRSLGLTGQFAAVDGVLTGRENLLLVARLLRLPDPPAIASGLLERFSLSDAADRPAGTYSGGMRRRLDIAMGLAGDPPVLLLDEPTTGLDPQSRREAWQLIRGLAESGTTILLTTQYLDEAEHLADHIAILHEGTIIQQGTLAELQAQLPPATTELVTKRPSLEEIFLELTGSNQRTEGSQP